MMVNLFWRTFDDFRDIVDDFSSILSRFHSTLKDPICGSMGDRKEIENETKPLPGVSCDGIKVDERVGGFRISPAQHNINIYEIVEFECWLLTCVTFTFHFFRMSCPLESGVRDEFTMRRLINSFSGENMLF
jgi:hypothetical protein